jgi:hypothetical protein
VTATEEYELLVTPPAGRALADELPEPVATAVIPGGMRALARRRGPAERVSRTLKED